MTQHFQCCENCAEFWLKLKQMTSYTAAQNTRISGEGKSNVAVLCCGPFAEQASTAWSSTALSSTEWSSFFYRVVFHSVFIHRVVFYRAKASTALVRGGLFYRASSSSSSSSGSGGLGARDPRRGPININKPTSSRSASPRPSSMHQPPRPGWTQCCPIISKPLLTQIQIHITYPDTNTEIQIQTH